MALINGCQKEEILANVENNPKSNTLITMRSNSNNKPDIHTQIVLGGKIKNPYTVKNMQSAFNYYNSIIGNSHFINKIVKATSLYIKITPRTIEDLEKLDNLDNVDAENALTMQDYPMDYKIITEGDYYVDPINESDLFYPIYTVIPVGYQLPSGINYEVLDELYEPSDEEYDIETVSLVFSDFTEDLEADDILVTTETLPEYLISSNNAANNSGLSLGSFMSRRKFTPEGYVMVQNTDPVTNDFVPLMQAKISYGRLVFWHYTYTQDSGYYHANHSYRGKVRVRAKWRGYTATIRKTWNEILGFFVSDHLITLDRHNNGETKYIDYGEPHTGAFGIDLEGGHLWYKGTVHNGLRKYVVYCDLNGISQTISYANVWTWARGEDASTPMLHMYPQLALYSTIANVGQANFWHVMVNSISGIAINILPSHLRPDQIFAGLKPRSNEGTTSSTVRIHQTVFHESGHYSHASKAGSWFWAQVFASEISNTVATWGSGNSDPYRDGAQPFIQAGKRIALAEGWGKLTEFKVSQYYYGKARINSIYANNTAQLSTNITEVMEGFDTLDTPVTATTNDDFHWFMHGIMWDLLDNNVDNSFSNRYLGNGQNPTLLIDNAYIGMVNQYDLSSIFNRLNNNVHDHEDLRNSILPFYPLVLQTKINSLFNSYYGPI